MTLISDYISLSKNPTYGKTNKSKFSRLKLILPIYISYIVKNFEHEFESVAVPLLKYLYEGNKICDSEYMNMLLNSMLFYELDEVRPAILYFRQAFRSKNTGIKDPLYNKKFSEKRELFLKKASHFDWTNIDSKVLEPGFCEKNKKQKNKKQNIENLLSDLKDLGNILDNMKGEISQNENLVFLQYIKTLNKLYSSCSQIEVYKKADIIFDIIISSQSIIKNDRVTSCEIFYLYAKFQIELYIINQNFVEIIEVYRSLFYGIKSDYYENSESENKFSEYTKITISLIDSVNKYSLVNNQNDDSHLKINRITSQEIADISVNHLLQYKCSSNKESESKSLSIGDIYVKIKKYTNAIIFYLRASNFSNKKHYFLPKKYSQRLAKIFDLVSIEQIKYSLNEAKKENDLDINNQFYSMIWYGIGKEIFTSVNKSISSNKKDEHHFPISTVFKQSIAAYTEALKNSEEGFKEKIYLSRSKCYRRLYEYSLARDDLEKALNFDRKEEGKLPSHRFRILLKELALTIFLEEYKRDINVKNIFSNYRKYYIDRKKFTQTILDKKKSKSYQYHYNSRISSTYICQGNFIYDQYKYLGHQNIELQNQYLNRAYDAYSKAFEISIASLESIEEISPHVLYLLLDICKSLIDISFELKYYEKTQKYLRHGSEYLEDLLYRQGAGGLNKKSFSYITKNKLEETFETIEDYRISFIKDKKTALEHAEMRKNICLTKLLSQNSDEDRNKQKAQRITYTNLRRILNRNTAVIYWHVGLSEISAFMLLDDRVEPVVCSARNIDYGYTNYYEIQKFIEYRKGINKWTDILNQLSNDNFEYTLSQISDCLDLISNVLDLSKIYEQLELRNDIYNIILVPHRDLHRIPLHVFFNTEYGMRNNHKYYFSYLPSLSLGLQAKINQFTKTDLFLIHPYGDTDQDLYGCYAESAAVYLRCISSTQKIPEIANGYSDVSRKALMHVFQYDIHHSILHFLGHARHDYKNPKQSALQLSTKEKLSLVDMKTLDFSNYFLVCLSACQTGVASPDNHLVEYVGLVSAFLEKGVSYVISSLWKIEDISASLLMIYFYQLLLNRKTHPVLALQKSQQWLRRSSRKKLCEWCILQAHELSILIDSTTIPIDQVEQLELSVQLLRDYSYELYENEYPYSHPYYWAGYIITGLPPG